MSYIQIYFTLYILAFGLWCAIPTKTDGHRILTGIFVCAVWPFYLSTLFFKYLFYAFPQTRVQDNVVHPSFNENVVAVNNDLLLESASIHDLSLRLEQIKSQK